MDILFWIYWGAIVGFLLVSIGFFRDYVGHVVGQLLADNNWRLVTLYILAITFTISALLAGFGEPVLFKEARKVKEEISEEITPKWKQEWNYILYGERVLPQEQKEIASKENYSSWWHWKLTVFFWVLALIYTPIALRDEIADAFSVSWQKFQQNRMERGEESEEDKSGTEEKSSSSTEGKTTSEGPFVNKSSFLWRYVRDFSTDFIAEISSNVATRFMRR